MDSKLQTFALVCRTMNYRQAAELLHLTQPAVTKQIQSLEDSFGTKLFHYDGRRLHKTESCLLLERYASSHQYRLEELKLAMAGRKRTKLRIGATKTIGDYVLGPAIIEYLRVPEHEISLTVDNTKNLLDLLDAGELDFAVIEGIFSKTKYDHYLLKMEPFSGVCREDSPLAGRQVELEELLDQTLILREEGSGTRNIFETRLSALGYGTEDFRRTLTISSFLAIKQMVRAGVGISFVYDSVAAQEPGIAFFTVEGLTQPHPFQVVYTKDTPAGQYAREFLGEKL